MRLPIPGGVSRFRRQDIWLHGTEEGNQMQLPQGQMVTVCDDMVLVWGQPLTIQIRTIGTAQITHQQARTTSLKSAMAAGNALLIAIELRQVENLLRTGIVTLTSEDQGGFERKGHVVP
jgi:hypothetical protein